MKPRFIIPLTAVIAASALLFTGCAGKEKLLRSTKEEATVIGTVGGFDVPMELYRYVALNYRADYENGETDVWLGESGSELLEKLNTSVDDTIVSLYTTMAMCKDYGISADDEYITDTVERKMGDIYGSYAEDYRAYNDDLESYNMNDSVYRFITRNDVLAEELSAEMVKRGEIPDFSDKEAFREIAEGDEFIRVKQILVAVDGERDDGELYEKAEMIKAKLDAGADFETVLWDEGEDVFMFSNDDGYYISRGSFYTEFEDAAFALDIGETSGIVKTPAGYCIIKRYEKEPDYIDGNLEDMYLTYRDGLYNLALEAKKAELKVEWNEKAEKYTIFNLKNAK